MKTNSSIIAVVSCFFACALSCVMAYDNVDKKIAREIYTQEMEDGSDKGCIYRYNNPLGKNSIKFLGLLRSVYHSGASKNIDFSVIDLNAVIEDFKNIEKRLDRSYCFNPSKDVFDYRDKNSKNMDYAYFYLLYESLNVYKKTFKSDIVIPEFDTNFICKKYACFQNYSFHNERSHYTKAEGEAIGLNNEDEGDSEMAKKIPQFVDLYVNDIVDVIPMPLLLCEIDSAVDLAMLAEDENFTMKAFDTFLENVRKGGRYLFANDNIQYRIASIENIANSSVKLIKVVGIGTAQLNEAHYGYIPSNVWDLGRKVKIKEEKNRKELKEYEEKVKKEREQKELELKAKRTELQNNLDTLRNEYNKVKNDLKKNENFLKSVEGDESPSVQRLKKDTIKEISKQKAKKASIKKEMESIKSQIKCIENL